MLDTEAPLIKVKQVSKVVKNGDNIITILRKINLEINQGETIAIIGASGSGKTTLLSLLAGLDLPTSGEIFYRNQALHNTSDDTRTALRAKHSGFVFQAFQLLPRLTALENVMLPLEIQYSAVEDAKKKAMFWLEQVGLGHRSSHYPDILSGGEQQRVAIARAFVTQPEIIFADEMTGNLDEKIGKQVIDLIFSLNSAEGTTLVMVTHDHNLAARCHRQVKLHDGTLHAC